MNFWERQALVRTVIEQVVLCGDAVKIYFKIPLPKPDPSAPGTDGSDEDRGDGKVDIGRLSSRFDLRSRARLRRRACP